MRITSWLFGALLSVLGAVAGAETLSYTTYYHNDHLGSPVAATNEKGALLWRAHFRPYGERQENPQDAAYGSVGYTGHAQDADSGMVYAGARYYDPLIGRFMAVDPVGVNPGSPSSSNRYAYTNNNPYRYSDPDGRFPVDYLVDGLSVAASSAIYANDPSFSNGIALAADVVLAGLPYIPAGVGLVRGGDKLLDAKKTADGVEDAVTGEVPLIKAGSAGGETAGLRFSQSVKDAAKVENPTATCVYCRIEGTGTQVDHAIPRARNGNATLDNAQLACPHCNASKGAGDFPKTPPAGYVGPWPPKHW